MIVLNFVSLDRFVGGSGVKWWEGLNLLGLYVESKDVKVHFCQYRKNHWCSSVSPRDMGEKHVSNHCNAVRTDSCFLIYFLFYIAA